MVAQFEQISSKYAQKYTSQTKHTQFVEQIRLQLQYI